ncbi:MAG: acyltransferase [Sedimenticolaceae bacterium]
MEAQRKLKQHAFELYRATAVMMVVCAHYIAAAKDLPPVVKGLFSAFTYLGVWLFFIISGYLLAASLMSLLRSGNTVSRAVATFFAKRVLRIYPAYLVSLAVFSGLIGVGALDFLVHSLNLHNLFAGYNRSINAVYWTLAVEFQWYLVAPLLIVFFIRSSIAVAVLMLGALIALSLAGRLFFLDQYYQGSMGLPELVRLVQDQMPIHLFNFCIGIVIYKLRAVTFLRRRWHIAVLIGILIYLGGEISGLMKDVVQRDLDMVRYKLILLYLAIVVLGITVHSLLHVQLNQISYVVISFVSSISYSLYIYHYPIIEYLKDFQFAWPSLLVLYVILAISASTLSYYLVEAPFLRYSARLGRAPRSANAH